MAAAGQQQQGQGQGQQAGARQLVTAYHSRVIDAPAEEVWRRVRSFGGICDWFPLVGSCRIVKGVDNQVGCVRMTGDPASGGKAAHERLLAISDKERSMTYDVLCEAWGTELPREACPFPTLDCANYEATFRLHPITQGNKTFAEYRGRFEVEPAAAAAMQQWFDQVFPLLLAGMAQAATGVSEGGEAPAEWLEAKG